jgi:hypothetical protein
MSAAYRVLKDAGMADDWRPAGGAGHLEHDPFRRNRIML